MFTLLDLFSGIGGFSLGLERAGGFRTVAFCEREPYCRAVLAKHWPAVPCYDDVRTLTAQRLAADGIVSIDAISGGFPCQDVSFSGHGKAGRGQGVGLRGERSGLWREFQRLISELSPRVAIIENVAALRSRGLGTVLRDLNALGYDTQWHCIPASAVGAPHRRDRLWIVANAHGQSESTVAVDDEMARLPASRAIWRLQRADWRDVEPDIHRVAHGLSNRVERNRALGNSVVPQIPQLIGEAIMRATL